MKTKTTIASQQTIQFLRDTIQRFETAILVTHGPGGELHARPMVISDTSSAGEMWFITNDSTPKVVELKQDARAMAIMQAPGIQVCVSGHALLKTDINSFASRLSAEARSWLDDSAAPVAIVLQPLVAEVWDGGEQERNSEVAIRRAQPADGRTRQTTIAFPPA